MTSVCSWPAPLACLVVRKPLRFWPRARSQAKTRQGPSFAQQKFFAPCLKSLVLSECGGAKEGEGGRPGMGGVLRNGFRMAGRSARYEREFEPKTVGLNEAARLIASMTKVWFHRSSPQVVSIRGLARLRRKLATACRLGNTTRDVPSFFTDLHVSTKGTWHHSPSLREPYRPGWSRGSQWPWSSRGSSARKADPHDSLSSPPSR